MNQSLKTIVLGAAIVAVASTAPALADGHSFKDTPIQHSPAFYAHGFAGVSFADDVDLSGTIGGAPQTVDVKLDQGLNVGGAIGVYLSGLSGSNFSTRVEGELSYRENDVDQIFFSGNGPAAEVNVDGDISSTLLMANLLVDFNVSPAFKPYVGGGIGVAFREFDFVYGPGVAVRDSNEDFAAQAIAGVAFGLTDNVDFTVDGRFTRIYDAESSRDAPNGASTGIVSGDIDTYTINGGLRFNF
ncbi:MAG: outer membrane beta-barrel protein [Pseudomonadota bacterium]